MVNHSPKMGFPHGDIKVGNFLFVETPDSFVFQTIIDYHGEYGKERSSGGAGGWG